MIRIPLLLCALFSANCAMAGYGTATIGSLLVGPDYGSKLFIGMVGISARASCSTNTNFSFVIDTSDPNGKLWAATLQMAYAAGKSVYVEGANTCTLYPDVESVRYIWVQ